MQHRGQAVALLAAGLAVMVGGLRPVAASHVNTDVRFLEFNFCGVAKSAACGGDYSLNEDGDPVDPNALPYYAPGLATSIKNFQPHVVVINEICEDQFDLLKADLASGPWTFQGEYFDWQEKDDRCDPEGLYGNPEGLFGNAILTRNAFTGPDTMKVWLKEWQGQGDEGRTVICATTTVGTIPLAVCAAKMSTGTLSAGEILVAMDEALDYANLGTNKALFIGGDFNVEPDETPFGQIYYTSSGDFQEMDQCSSSQGGRFGGPPAYSCNRYTHIKQTDPNFKNKIDYMFFRQAYAKNFEAEPPNDVASSDHHITKGTADICHESTC
jgi:endonuclease/exonuclease/phosphatase family metal-dependent hydrolase